MTQTWWLSFVDPDRPTGQQFLGVAIVDVTEADVEAARPIGDAIRAGHGLPPLEPDAAWIGAAIHKSHQTGCNPGGEVATMRLDDAQGFAEREATLPRDRLLSQAELIELGHA